MKALITGITGQDGSYLTEFLLNKGYEVHGIIRRSSSFNTQRIDHLYQDPHIKDRKLFLHYGDLTESSRLCNLIHDIHPDEVYNLAAQSHVKVSFDEPEYTADVTGIGSLRLLESIKTVDKKIKYYQASTSELYGMVQEIPQSETTPFYPRSPYGVAKLYSYWITKNYREAYGIFACNGILFNHESPRRGETFVTRKITKAASRIRWGLQDKLYLGNLNAKRDWGYAGDYVEGMWLMLQQKDPDDYVLATGETHTVEEFCKKAFDYVGLDYKKYVEVDSAYYRPSEVDLLLGNPKKAQEKLGWKSKTNLNQLVKMMMDSDLHDAKMECCSKKTQIEYPDHIDKYAYIIDPHCNCPVYLGN